MAVTDTAQLEGDLEGPVAAVGNRKGGYHQKQRGAAQGSHGPGRAVPEVVAREAASLASRPPSSCAGSTPSTDIPPPDRI